MEIVFNPKAGEIYSLFTSLYFGWNLESLENNLESSGISLKKELKEQYEYINEIHKLTKEQMDFFFNDESEIFRFFIVFPKIWESNSIDEYINYLETINESDLKEMLVRILIDNKLKNDDNCIKSIASTNDCILKFITDLDISKSSKWDLYCFINNIENFKQEFINLIKNYIPKFEILLTKQSSFINEINDTIAKNIKLQGIEFAKEFTNNIIELDNFKKIYLTNSYFDNYYYYFTLTKNMEHCYIVIGAYYEELSDKNNTLETHLKVLKNLCDKTRFGIMKYILTEEKYGQEIAEKFSLSNATISYHMNNLLLLNLVEISKQDNKIFYKLNKKRLIKTIKFLEKSFNLDT